MRDLFTDGWNSFWHFVFGLLGFYSPFVTILFVLYQLKDPFETNINRVLDWVCVYVFTFWISVYVIYQLEAF